MADWSSLPKDLLGLINGRSSETCFEIVHFLSVCSSWRSALPPPSHGRSIGFNFLLPLFNHEARFQGGNDTHCRLKKVQVFLLRFQTPFGADCLLVGMSQSKSGKLKLLSPLESTRRYRYGVTLNTLSSQIISLGDYYQIKFYAITTRRYRTRRERYTKRVAFLQEEDGKDFVVVAGVLGNLMTCRSCDKTWTKMECPFNGYRDMVSFKGKFYVVDMRGRGQVFVIEPSLEISEIQAVTQSHETFDERLVVVSKDELLLVQRITPGAYCHEHKHAWFRLFRLQEDKGQKRWVRVIDLEDRIVFLGSDWNLCYSAKELPGMKGNCVVFFDPKYSGDLLVYDLRTLKTSNACTQSGGYMGAFGRNQESLLACGIVTAPDHEAASMIRQIHQVHLKVDHEDAM